MKVAEAYGICIVGSSERLLLPLPSPYLVRGGTVRKGVQGLCIYFLNTGIEEF